MQKYHFDAEKMENSALRQQVKSKTQSLNNAYTQDFCDVTIKSGNVSGLIDGFKTIDKKEFHSIAKQLTLWGVSNSGAVIKREGPTFVRMAVYITLQNIDKVKSPKNYFRGVLKKLQNMSS